MSIEKIKVFLIHIRDRTIYKAVVVLTGEYPNCGLLFTSAVSPDIEVKGHDYYASLINLRIELEKQNYYFLCNGARKNITCGGMLRESSNGRLAYFFRLGKVVDLNDVVDIFEYAHPDLVVSIREQEEFNRLYSSSLKNHSKKDD